jgi:hypothetical protein
MHARIARQDRERQPVQPSGHKRAVPNLVIGDLLRRNNGHLRLNHGNLPRAGRVHRPGGNRRRRVQDHEGAPKTLHTFTYTKVWIGLKPDREPLCVFSPDFDNILEQEFIPKARKLSPPLSICRASPPSAPARGSTEEFRTIQRLGLDRSSISMKPSVTSSDDAATNRAITRAPCGAGRVRPDTGMH